MTARSSAAAALGLALLAATGASDPPAPPASTREAIYFGPAGPVRIRLHVSIDGRPADAVWAEAVDALFAFCDRNADGVLDPAERAGFAPPARREREVLELVADGSAQPVRLTFPPKEEKVSRAAFAEAVRASGQGSIGLRVVPARSDSLQLSAALFKHLDRDGDGRLSADELKAARDPLAGMDVDEDEFVTTAELLGRAVGTNPGPVRIAVPGLRSAEPVESSSDLVFLTADGPQGVKQLLAARGGPRATSLRPAEFGTDPKAFAALDKDGNGRLDTTELSAWLGRPPDLELSLVFDPATGRLVLPPGSQGSDPVGSFTASLPGGRFRFEPPDSGASGKAAWDEAAGRLRDQFKELATGSGSVERKQLERQPAALPLFDLADRNADGKADAAEVEAALKAVVPLARRRVEVTFADQGDGLFELLDRDTDGRLSPRELVGAADALKPFAGPDGAVGPKDLVRQFRVRAAVEPIPVGVPVPPARPALTGSERPAGVPAWFARMDRNGDGDVSLREFVGPIGLFRKLDRDGDGLLSPAEATAADR
jgi:Ca2+-binding EF-hand superfamily protein